ncbi:MAG: hypothetical protein HKN26_06180 [Acidimicrobiales bacterium]|nr:hypothetical protein [Acidimicrobiales bacterium]
MAIEVETKDCTSLSDAEMEEMADISAEGPNTVDVGVLSKQAEAWVLVTEARENGKLKGYSFCTLERIGGTPAVIIGLASVKRASKRDSVLRAMMTDQLRRAVLAFPDEDVVVGTRFNDPSGFEAFKSLHDLVPRPDHKASGEERAWGRRFAKRFGIETARYEDRIFTARGDGPPCVFDHSSLKPEKINPDVAALFDQLTIDNGDALVAFGWALAEELEKLG